MNVTENLKGSFRTKNNGKIEYRIYINGKSKSFSGTTKEECIERCNKFLNDERNKQLYEASLLTDITGIRINKNSFEYRKSLNGKQVDFHSNNIESILKIKEYVDQKIDKAGIITNINQTKQKDNILKKHIYFISNGAYCKIGIATNLKRRISDLQVGNTNQLTLLYSFQTTDYDNIEKQLHKLFEPFKVSGEWYDILFLFQNKQNNDDERAS